MNSLEIQHLKEYFPTAKGYSHAMDDVSSIIEEGTTLGMVGEFGYGKSTLGRLILHLLGSTEGEIYYKGDNILACDEHEICMVRQKVQIIFRDSYESLNPRANVEEIISETLTVNKPYWSKTELDDKIYELVGTVEPTERSINSYPYGLDGGRRQRIGIARALALSPEPIVYGEPVSTLDVSIQAQILNLVQDLQKQKGFTYMFITYNLSVVKHVSDNIMVMYLGRIVELVPKKLLFSHPSHPYTRALLATIPVPKPSSRNKQKGIIHGEIAFPINPGDECGFAKRYPFAKEICFQIKPEPAEMKPGYFVAYHEYL